MAGDSQGFRRVPTQPRLPGLRSIPQPAAPLRPPSPATSSSFRPRVLLPLLFQTPRPPTRPSLALKRPGPALFPTSQPFWLGDPVPSVPPGGLLTPSGSSEPARGGPGPPSPAPRPLGRSGPQPSARSPAPPLCPPPLGPGSPTSLPGAPWPQERPTLTGRGKANQRRGPPAAGPLASTPRPSPGLRPAHTPAELLCFISPSEFSFFNWAN